MATRCDQCEREMPDGTPAVVTIHGEIIKGKFEQSEPSTLSHADGCEDERA